MGHIGADTAKKLAGLQVDLLQKIRNGQITLEQLKWFNTLSGDERDWIASGANYATAQARIVVINKPFDLSGFSDDLMCGYFKGWGIIEWDDRAFNLSQIDVSRVALVTMLKEKEEKIDGEERLRRIKEAGYIPLGANIFQILYNNQNLIPIRWKRTTENQELIWGPTEIPFDGTILRSPEGGRFTLTLFYNGYWTWIVHSLESESGPSQKSAVLIP